MNIELSDAIPHIKNNKKMYLGADIVHPDILATYIADDALVLGAGQIIIRHDESWYIVGADIDWLMKGHDRNLSDIFSCLLPLEGGGQNALRREPVLMAFARDIVLATDTDDITVIKGNYESELVEKFLSENAGNISRVFAFSFGT